MKISGTPEGETDDMAVKCYTMMKNMYQKDYSEILKLFFGIHVSQIVNPKTKKILSNAPEPFFMVETAFVDVDSYYFTKDQKEIIEDFYKKQHKVTKVRYSR